MKKKSIGINAVLNTIQTIMSMVFPLITFPYISRVLGVDEVGKYNFSSSFVSYFVLIAGLGISTYATREGAKFRDDKEKMSVFVKDVFSINVYSTILAYVLLFVFVLNINKFHSYMAIISVLSIQIGFGTIGRGWIYSIYEDYLFITIRSVVFQFVSVLLLLTFVKTSEDVILYTCISIFASVGSNIVNFICSGKYCKLQFTFRPDRKHLVPILLIFSTAVSITVYASTDTVMLGFFGTDYHVGLYSVSVKIYTIIKQVVAAILTVAIPRFSYYLGNNDRNAFNKLFKNIFDILVFIMLPIVTGLCILSKEFILIIAGESYEEAYFSLSILSIAMVFNLLTYMFGYCVLLPNKEEKLFFKATLISAIVNLILNIVLIPQFLQNAAAITTVIAEAVAAVVCYIRTKRYVSFKENYKNVKTVVCGCIMICFMCILSKCLFSDYIFVALGGIFFSIVGYFIIQILMKNSIIIDLLTNISKKMHNERLS